jgi:pilus assembly protein TadC
MNSIALIFIGASTYLSFPLPQKPKSKRSRTEKTVTNVARHATSREVLQTLRLVRLCLTSGMTVVDALQFVQVRMGDPVASELGRVLYTNRLGRPLDLALTELAEQNSNWLSMSDSMIVGITSGTAIQDQLADLEVMLRTTMEMEKLKRIKAVAVKSVLPLGICFLPAFIMLAVIPMVAGLIGNFTK